MSLKSFHIFFVAASILFLIGFGLWFVLTSPSAVEEINVFGGLLSWSLAGGLLVYGIRFLQKYRNLRSQ